MNSCTEFEFLLSLQLDDALTRAEDAALAAHLQRCPSCRALQADFIQIQGDLHVLHAAPPTGLLAQMRAQLPAQEQRPAPPPKKHRNKRRQYQALFASAAVFALLLSAAFFGQTQLGGDSLSLAAPESAEAESVFAGQEPAPAEAIFGEAEMQHAAPPEEAPAPPEVKQALPATAGGHVDSGNPTFAQDEPAAGSDDTANVLFRELPPPASAQEPAAMSVDECDDAAPAPDADSSASAPLSSQLSPAEARALLECFFQETAESASSRSIHEAGRDETGQHYLFRVIDPDASEQLYRVHAEDGSILPPDDFDGTLSPETN